MVVGDVVVLSSDQSDAAPHKRCLRIAHTCSLMSSPPSWSSKRGGRGGWDRSRQHDGVVAEIWWKSGRASLRTARMRDVRNEREAASNRGVRCCGQPLPPLFIGMGKEAWPLLQASRGCAPKGGRKSPPSFPTDRDPSFLGILILSLRDLILFLLGGGGFWCAWTRGVAPWPTIHVHVGPSS